MAIINQRWPEDLCPVSCEFGPTRNDVLQASPFSRQTSLIVRGRRLWRANLTWQLPRTNRLAKLRFWLESLEGFAGSVQIWDFNNPYPEGIELAEATAGRRMLWTRAGSSSFWSWTGLPSHWQIGSTAPLSAPASAGATSITVSGLDASKIAVLQGQYVQVGRRLYIAAADASSNGSGVATITLQTGLLAAAAAGDLVRLVQAGCEMQLAEQDWSHSGSAGGLVTVSASFLETVTDFV